MARSDDLQDFVRDALAAGATRAEVEAVLVHAGWGVTRAKAAIAEFAEVEFVIPVPRPRPSLDARDAFLYVVLFSTLYVTAFNLGRMVFEFIDRAFPDRAFQSNAGLALSSLRWSIASLVVATPVFLFVSSRVQGAIRQDPVKRGSKVRRWLTYLTLAVASGIIVGDFITLVYYVLAGEVSSRFLLKVATVGAIAGGVFFFYLWNLKIDEKGSGAMGASPRTLLGVIFGTATAAAVAGGFLMVGSPGEARLKRLDDQRVKDLQWISSVVNSYRTRTGTLPASLDAVHTQGAWRMPPHDPETGHTYEYRVLVDNRYELCATFDRGSDEEHGLWSRDVFWAHTSGRQCFRVDVPDVRK
jgi:Domain of unknown function (DUF5671)